MPREGLGYEQVVEAAEALLGEGRQPSIRAVRERLHRHEGLGQVDRLVLPVLGDRRDRSLHRPAEPRLPDD